MATTSHKIGSEVYVPFGAGKFQRARVEGYTRTGKVKVRAYNATQGKWMPNTRTLDPEDIHAKRP